MRQVDIDPARGFSGQVDPSVAPQGTLVRVENMRVDKDGRLVLRAGYSSLALTVEGQSTATTLVPRDLHTLGGDLLALGSESSANQPGIRAVYKFVDSPRGAWRTEHDQDARTTSEDFYGLPPADSMSVLLSESEAWPTDSLWCDVAVDSTGRYVALASSIEDATFPGARVTVVDTELRKVVFHQSNLSLTFPLTRNARILAIGTVFYLFEQVATEIRVRTWDSASSAQNFGAQTAIATGVSALPARYDVAPFTGSTDYLLAFPTATGYTWRRFNSANVQQTTTNVASLADAPVGICGASGETVSVVNIRAVSGVELRTFNTAGVLAVGPTDLDPVGATVYDWCAIARLSSTLVQCGLHRGTSASGVTHYRTATTAAHALQTQNEHDNAKGASKILAVNGVPFVWEALGGAAARPFGLSSIGLSTTSRRALLAGIVLDGAAPQVQSATAAPQKSALVAGTESRYYVGLVSQDSRDKTFRANLIECKIHSGERRQGVEAGGLLYLAGGLTTQYDGRTVAEVGFDTVPHISALTELAGGSLTALGTYVYQVVFRAVSATGAVTQSSPSEPSTITLTGVNQRVDVTCSTPYSIRRHQNQTHQGSVIYFDVYRTEAGGSIPRLVKSQRVVSAEFGTFETVIDVAADSAQQTGVALYTQGADGSISGRLPLGMASPSQYVAEADGRLIVGGLERPEAVHFSIENRPGETIGFINDDLFFLRNQERITGLATGGSGRRYLFGASNIREVVGQGPNAAGVGDISEPVEIENRVGCCDWRSICKTEHGIFFQASALGRPRIYLLPDAGGAIDASQGITDLLAQFPVVTSATRHDEEQLLTFSLQNSAGTDGRLLHLDLRTSGMGRSGWQGTWIVDRVSTLEAVQFPRILEERIHVFPAVFGTGTLTIDLPRARRVDDRVLVMATGLLAGSSGNLTIGTVTGMADTAFASIVAGLKSSATDFRQTSATDFQASVVVTYNTVTTASAIIVKTWHIRGAHASSAPEAQSVINVATTTFSVPALVPTWGSAKTLWIGAAIAAAASTDPGFPVVRGFPTGFGGVTRASTREAGSSGTSVDAAYCSRQFEGSTLTVAFTAVQAVLGPAWLIAYRPLATGGTPVRATTRHRGRLALCNSTDVLRSDPDAVSDPSSAVIIGEWEHADIHPMGPGGAGRHLGVGLMFELLGNTALYAWFSYDGGVSWAAVREFRFSPSTGFQIGQQCKVRWVPRRRKIDRVRMRLIVADDTTVSAGGTRGIALQRVTHWFEDLAGPARRQASVNNVGDRR